MMPGSPIVAVADDLTGAAEIGALGYRFGLPSVIVSPGGRQRADEAGLTVYDADSRLLSPEAAADAVLRTIAPAAIEPETPVFKKVDSVLRGNVLIECEALAAAAGRSRVLLVPANPAFGRTIRGGLYFVNGTPIHETVFATDPYHPAKSSEVADLLGHSAGMTVRVAPPGAELPREAMIVGEAASTADVAHWAGRVDASTLPAGGAEFFAAWLQVLGCGGTPGSTQPELRAPLLVVSGTTVPSSRKMLRLLYQHGVPVIPMADALAHPGAAGSVALQRWAEEIALALADRGVAVTLSPSHLSTAPGAGEAVRTVFAGLVKRLRALNAFSHLVVEGGATAAGIVRALGWTEMAVESEWGQGVVTLRPAGDPQARLTLKPGSYPWPAWWWERLAAGITTNRQ